MKLKDQLESAIRTSAGRRTHSALALLTHLFKSPVVSVKQVIGVCDLSTKAANDLVTLFVQRGIVREISGKTRYRLFLFGPYLDLFK